MEVLGLDCADADHRSLETPTELIEINLDAVLPCGIQFVDDHKRRYLHLAELHGQVEVSLQVGSIDHIDDHVIISTG